MKYHDVRLYPTIIDTIYRMGDNKSSVRSQMGYNRKVLWKRVEEGEWRNMR